MIRHLAKLQNLSQRWLYLGTILLLLVPFAVTIPMPPGDASVAARGLYDTIEACPPDKVVLIQSAWDMGSRAENQAQLTCVVRHLCRNRVRFVVVSVARPFGPEFAAKVIEPIAAEAGYVYGRDWVNTGFIQATGGLAVVADGLARDLHALRPADVKGTPVSEIPLMRHVRTIEDVHLLCVVSYGPPEEWIGLVKGQFGTNVAFGCMSIMGPRYYTYIDSKQLCGMLVGNRGAADYEALLARPGMGTRLIGVASFGNGIIILAAILGNV
jgi:hypothetical protein